MGKLTQDTIDRYVQIIDVDLAKITAERDKLVEAEQKLRAEAGTLKADITSNAPKDGKAIYKSKNRMVIVEGKKVEIAEIAQL